MLVLMKFIPIKKAEFTEADKLLAKYVGYIVLVWFMLSLAVEIKSGTFALVVLSSLVIATYYFINKFIDLVRNEKK